MTIGSDNTYELIDSGDGRKFERFGSYSIIRPCSQAIWHPKLPQEAWLKADATFDRENGNNWNRRAKLPDTWNISVAQIKFRLSSTDFGHLGIFPEQQDSWSWIRQITSTSRTRLNVLNLFAYSGGSTMAAALSGATCCHLDAAAGMVDWAKENAKLNNLDNAPIRWIVDDAHKFMQREIRRAHLYDAIILDPPSFGRGAKGEVYKIDRDLQTTLRLCRQLLSPSARFILLSAHTPGITPISLTHMLNDVTGDLGGQISSGEMLLSGAKETRPVPCGCMARWLAR